ncbi:hypothetical protein [Mesorhizobium cantuariense]|uniref:Uncharacterized protein n=1 Tax=Mesorhizobium cantuariense TaxID=1300275 RepID=A0ABV7MN58_9HYPH
MIDLADLAELRAALFDEDKIGTLTEQAVHGLAATDAELARLIEAIEQRGKLGALRHGLVCAEEYHRRSADLFKALLVRLDGKVS